MRLVGLVQYTSWTFWTGFFRLSGERSADRRDYAAQRKRTGRPAGSVRLLIGNHPLEKTSFLARTYWKEDSGFCFQRRTERLLATSNGQRILFSSSKGNLPLINRDLIESDFGVRHSDGRFNFGIINEFILRRSFSERDIGALIGAKRPELRIDQRTHNIGSRGTMLAVLASMGFTSSTSSFPPPQPPFHRECWRL